MFPVRLLLGITCLLAVFFAVRADYPKGHPRFSQTTSSSQTQNQAKIQSQAQGKWVYEYKVPDGQDQWAGYCSQQGTQSPVLIRPLNTLEVVEDKKLNPLLIDIPVTHSQKFFLTKTDKTIVFGQINDNKVAINASGAALVKNEKYTFQHSYFHAPSEHQIEGINTDLEWTFVFRDTGVPSLSPLEEYRLEAPSPPKEDPVKREIRLKLEKEKELENYSNVRKQLESSFAETDSETESESESESETETEVESESESESESEASDETEFGPFKTQLAAMKKQAKHQSQRESANFAHVSVLFRIGNHNPLLQTLIDNFQGRIDLPYRKSYISFNLTSFFKQFTGENSAYFTYAGSHTAPPCRADVVWTIYANILQLSTQQYQQIKQYLNDGKDNRRDVQSLGQRKIYAYAYNPTKSAEVDAKKHELAQAAVQAKKAAELKKLQAAKKKQEAERKEKERAEREAKLKAAAEAAMKLAEIEKKKADKLKEEAEIAASNAKLEKQTLEKKIKDEENKRKKAEAAAKAAAAPKPLDLSKAPAAAKKAATAAEIAAAKKSATTAATAAAAKKRDAVAAAKKAATAAANAKKAALLASAAANAKNAKTAAAPASTKTAAAPASTKTATPAAAKTAAKTLPKFRQVDNLKREVVQKAADYVRQQQE